MRIGTWNVNSVRVRLGHLLGWLERHRPDVVCLQELKCREEDFPWAEIEAAGYRALVAGQKTYNGVAILSRHPIEDPDVGLHDPELDEAARLVSATVDGVRVMSAYVPQGATMSSPKYPYKLQWLDRLARFLAEEHLPTEPLVLCGDFNVITRELDAARPERWEGTVVFNPEVVERLHALRGWGLVDTFGALHPDEQAFTWWDYRRGSFQRDDGLRIDYVFATEPMAGRLRACQVHREERARERPSDHAPVLAEFEP